MTRSRLIVVALALLSLALAAPAGPLAAQGVAGTPIQVTKLASTGRFNAVGEGINSAGRSGIRRRIHGQPRSNILAPSAQLADAPVNRALSGRTDTPPPPPALGPPVVPALPIVGANPGLTNSFQGINALDRASVNSGFVSEPPDQGLCVGNGFVLETINGAMQVRNQAGTPLSGVTDLNTFYGFPLEVALPSFTFGPFLTDPTCYYDPDTQRWFHLILTLETNPVSGGFTGRNFLDLAVSATNSPLGTWNIYRIPAHNNGADGTPNHACSLGFCLGDFPHIGADRYGFYITTNEYSFFGPEFTTAQMYAISKRALATGAAGVNVFLFDRLTAVGKPGFTIRPAQAPSAQYAAVMNGTQFFLSSTAAEEAGNATGFDRKLILWAMTNTRSLEVGTPALRLANQAVETQVYGTPPPAQQKAGPAPMLECLNDATTVTPFGTGCWTNLLSLEPPHNQTIQSLDSIDTRVQQVAYSAGLLWGALGTVVNVGGELRSGIAYFIIQPSFSGTVLVGRPVRQGYVAVAGNNVLIPATAVLPSGKGLIAFTLTGPNHFPSAAYAPLSLAGVTEVHVAAAGAGPQDGFAGYNLGTGPGRPRWGDYGGVAVDGNDIWFASEYIAQTCTLAQYLAAPLGQCGGTRDAFGNWSTRVSRWTPAGIADR
ncbi:MAG: hypothetical protein U0531_18020 [Dehalococcoidia bacterium]